MLNVTKMRLWCGDWGTTPTKIRQKVLKLTYKMINQWRILKFYTLKIIKCGLEGFLCSLGHFCMYSYL